MCIKGKSKYNKRYILPSFRRNIVTLIHHKKIVVTVYFVKVFLTVSNQSKVCICDVFISIRSIFCQKIIWDRTWNFGKGKWINSYIKKSERLQDQIQTLTVSDVVESCCKNLKSSFSLFRKIFFLCSLIY